MGSYTFSKALGTSSSDGFTINPFFSPQAWNYGPLNYDRTQVVGINYNWILPGKNRLARGWQLSGITRVTGGDVTGSGSFPTRLVVTDPSLPPTERFRAPARGELGNLGTNSFRKPRFPNHDLSVYRNLKWERVHTQLRFESYNTLNHTQFSALSTGTRFNTVGSTEQIEPLFLKPSSARNQRRIPIAIRVTF